MKCAAAAAQRGCSAVGGGGGAAGDEELGEALGGYPPCCWQLHFSVLWCGCWGSGGGGGGLTTTCSSALIKDPSMTERRLRRGHNFLQLHRGTSLG